MPNSIASYFMKDMDRAALHCTSNVLPLMSIALRLRLDHC